VAIIATEKTSETNGRFSLALTGNNGHRRKADTPAGPERQGLEHFTGERRAHHSRLAPKGQEGTFLGFAFLPIAVGYLIGGPLGGWLVRYFGTVVHRPSAMWFVVSAIGVLTAGSLWLYDRIFMPVQGEARQSP
jgi:hypothetical protein